jgi:hypothetical protein
MLAHVQSTRLNEWWPAAIVGLLAALLGPTDGNAQVPNHRGLSLAAADAQRVAESMAANSHNWRQDFRSYVQRTADRRGIVDRTKGVLAAYRDRCEDSCSVETVRQAVQTASGAACAAAVVPLSIEPNFVLPTGSIGFDFQPRGANPAPGFRPVVPGDSRLSGGQKPLAGASKEDLSSDSLSDVRRFRDGQLADGEYRVIVVGAAGDTSKGNPFGTQVVINGRTIDISGNGPAAIAAQMGDAVRNVRLGGSSQAPMLVFDIVVSSNTLDLQFLTGAVVSGLVVEPVGNKSVLDMTVAGGGVTSVEQCMSATTELQEATSEEVVTKRNRVSDIGSLLNGGGGGGGAGGGGLPNNASPLSGN